MRRSTRKEQDPDLGILAVQLSARVQREIFTRAAEHGFADVRPRHGAVLAYLDTEGTRPGELARLAGRNKQTMGAILDELERLGYVRRAPDPADRRAKLIIPTERGLEFMEVSDGLVDLIEQNLSDMLGADLYREFKTALSRGVASLPATGHDTEG
ncbi:MarR family transcriptional regulator [Micromonospora sp. RHAY321]|uniref:MarR family winged helix-turn-helix transcriptional regulator n=1 Tax=Micromonospora sp. RHAY321 TaxID=2944807 RepID=UPI00207C3395|nr:MarR family transcriptional regulator [Micromonospora sp. RHAY321]MCO1595876.1 MarR family transcriptional regulator [Micromonospora sp. RHAY321]